MISIDNAQNEIGLPDHIDDGREWAEWLLKKADGIKSGDFLTVPRSAVLKKELQQLEQCLNTMKAEWQKKFALMELIYELEAHFLVEESSND
ncbi:hypothetical protein [Xenorhabdus bovienii]|uniref:Uncharacterized protein n=1 Tax=Xenorhabdus bovienii str. feltiae Moldova TaxID=1398200 RepID=A0A077NUZ3_XENBV|nr:hypothetical protein [Xenorhabdus bovienii]CDH02193.1 hypothetical protein XBFM1_2520003 [Xenorhabdus bovienii str. feltiae Moldova]